MRSGSMRLPRLDRDRLHDPVLGHLSPDELDQLIKQQIPLGPQGTPDDIAPSVVFLASDWARYITRQSLVIDGALTTM